MNDHKVIQCKHGVTLSQCRCPSKDKTVVLRECPPSHSTEEFLAEHSAAN